MRERKEKNCLNCNAVVAGRYCHICGQENIETKESAWHLVTHYFQDLIHFDGKFFVAVKYLLFKPGFLAQEYNMGRRASYLNPVKMYVFTSAMFFLLFFTVVSTGDVFKISRQYRHSGYMGQLDKKITIARQAAQVANDSSSKARVLAQLDSLHQLKRRIANDSLAGQQHFLAETQNQLMINLENSKYTNIEEYQATQKNLPESKRDNYFTRQLIIKSFKLSDEYKGNPSMLQKNLFDKFLHKFPQLFFISLPFFAFILQALYFRHKQLYYVNHVVFTIYYYVFVFIIMALFIGLSKLSQYIPTPIYAGINIALNVGVMFYLYKAMRNFYQQRRAKTLLKLTLLLLSFLMLMSITFVAFFFLSLFQL